MTVLGEVTLGNMLVFVAMFVGFCVTWTQARRAISDPEVVALRLGLNGLRDELAALRGEARAMRVEFMALGDRMAASEARNGVENPPC